MATSSKDTLQELQWLSDRVSTQVRIIALGVLALAWGLLVSPQTTVPINTRGLIAVGLLAIFVIVLDLAQYIAGYLNTLKHHRRLYREGIEEDYNRNEPLYRLRTRLFWAKQVLAGATFLVLIAVVLPALFA